ncbi:alpha-amylase family protein [candidate division KSB1 bacterium]
MISRLHSMARMAPRLMLALLLASSLPLFSGPVSAQETEGGYELPIRIGHEPLIFQIRRGTATTDAVERWEAAHSEANIKKISESGQRMLYTHFYKGYGFDAEKEEMDLAAKAHRYAKKYGMVSGVYVQWATVTLETFLKEDPRAKDWILRDRNGHGVKIAYGHYYWRYLPDIRNPEYMTWYKEKILKYCVEQIKPSYIFLDNVAENPPVSWQPITQKNWVEGFRDYLRNNYSSAELTEMIGYPSVDFVEPPYWVWGRDVVVNDPIMQRWIDFRCQSVNDAVTEVCEYIKSLDPNIAVGINLHGISRENRAIRGIDPIGVCDGTGVDGWGGELWVQSELTDDGTLISPIRELSAARNLKLAFTSGGRGPLGRAVKLAYSYRHKLPGGNWIGAPGERLANVGGLPKDDNWNKYIDYYRDVETVTDVAVLRSYPSLAYNSEAPLKSTLGFEQTLIQSKVPFDIIFEKNLTNLSKYKVLVLANTECLSDGDVELVRAFVKNGGGLVATGSASLYNQWRRPRPNFGLGDVLGLTADEADKTRQGYRISDAMSTWIGVEGINTRMTKSGKGRAVYVPRVTPSYEGSGVQLKLPVNWPELLDAVKWAAGGELSLDIDAPLTVVANLCRKNNNLMLHLVNFKQDLIENIPVNMTVPDGKKVKSIKLVSTDRAGEQKVKFEQEKDRLSFRVPQLTIYDMLIISL